METVAIVGGIFFTFIGILTIAQLVKEALSN